MVNFLLIIDEIASYNKKNIDQGKIPTKIYRICCAIKETFCLSYAIRKDNNLILYFINNKVAIKLLGNQLRYLSSDERSQAILLNKAFKILEMNGIPLNWKQSTPGIFIKKFTDDRGLLNEIINANFSQFFIIEYKNDKVGSDFDLLRNQTFLSINTKSLFIIYFNKSNKIHLNSILNKSEKYSKEINLYHISKAEDQILWINFILDIINQQNNNRR